MKQQNLDHRGWKRNNVRGQVTAHTAIKWVYASIYGTFV